MQSYTTQQNSALLVVRLIVGVIFLYAAYAKIPLWSFTPEGMTEAMINLMKFLTVVEFLGGTALVIGFLTKWAARGLAVIMVGAVLVMQFMMQVGFATATGAGWNFPLAVLAGCITLMVFGAGSWSVDAKQKS